MKRIISLICIAIMFLSNLPNVLADDTSYSELQKFAVFSTDLEPIGTKTVENLQLTPGNANKYFQISKAPEDMEFPVNIDIDFCGFTVDVRDITLISRYGMTQGIKNIDIDIENNGTWENYMRNVPIKWVENWQTPENYTVPSINFKAQKIRIKINDAYKTSTEIRLDTISVKGRIVDENAKDYMQPVYYRSGIGYPVRIQEYVKVLCPDGSFSKLDVEWNNVPSGNEEGSFLVNGKVKGSDIPVKAIVDVVDKGNIIRYDGWANGAFAAAQKAGYLVGIAKGPYETADINTAAKIIAGMLNMDLAYPKDYKEGRSDIFEETIRKYYDFENRDYLTRLEAVKLITSYAKSVTSYIPDDSKIPEFTDTQAPEAEYALKLGIISNSKLFRPDDKATLAEIISMCFGLKRVSPFNTVTTYDTGASVTSKAGGFVKAIEELDNADVGYIKINKNEFLTENGYDFGYIDTCLSKCRNAGKKAALYILSADEECIKTLSDKYADSDILAFIDAENIELEKVWEKYFPKTKVFIAEGQSRDGGRFSFDCDNAPRFICENISFSEGVTRDEGFMINIDWRNLSNISYGEDLYPALTLKTQAGNVASAISDVDFNLKDLAGGGAWECSNFPVSAHVAAATYKAYISLGTITAEPLVELPIGLENDGENRYYIGDITLWPMIYVIPHDGVDEEGNITIDIVRNDYAGEFFHDNNITFRIDIAETNKKLFTLKGDYTLDTWTANGFPEVKDAIVNHGKATHKAKINFDVENMKIRNIPTQKRELAGREFYVYFAVSTTGAGDFSITFPGWHTAQKIGILSIDNNLKYSFKSIPIEWKNE